MFGAAAAEKLYLDRTFNLFGFKYLVLEHIKFEKKFCVYENSLFKNVKTKKTMVTRNIFIKRFLRGK